MLLKENLFFKIKQLFEYDRQYNGNKITYLFFLRSLVPNDPLTGSGPRPGGWGPLLYRTCWLLCINSPGAVSNEPSIVPDDQPGDLGLRPMSPSYPS